MLADDYRWTFTVNFGSLVFGAFIFGILVKDSYAPIFAIFIGVPVLVVQVVVGVVPAWICLRRHGRTMSQAQKIVLLTLSVLPILVGVAGVAFGLAGIRLLH
ncbi:MAG: hypothetical protein JWN40_1334 [Phycisphaerales bacterium]|nr:hypothetical protein [Phycisphaerales bacterium]